MQYVFKNLKSFALNYTGIFILVIVCQLVCVLLTFFSFGVYQNFLNESDLTAEGISSEEFEGYHNVQVSNELPEGAEIYPAKLNNFYAETVNILGNKIDMITTDCENNIELLLKYKEGKFIFPEDFKDNMIRNFIWSYGRSFTEDEFTNGDKVCIAPSLAWDKFDDPYGNKITTDETAMKL